MQNIETGEHYVHPWWKEDSFTLMGTCPDCDTFDMEAIITEANARRDKEWIKMLRSMEVSELESSFYEEGMGDFSICTDCNNAAIRRIIFNRPE